MGHIALELGVSKSTVSLWTRDIELTDEQKLKNWRLHQSSDATEKRCRARSDKCRTRREEAQEAGRVAARARDSEHASGCMLYWAEGTKDRNQLAFSNSDVHMVQAFVRFLRESFGVPNDDFVVRLNVYLNNDISLEAIETHWLDALALPRSCLRGHQINHFPTSSSGKKRSLPYGVCTLRVKRSTPILQHIYGAIQEYGGFEEPKWLG